MIELYAGESGHPPTPAAAEAMAGAATPAPVSLKLIVIPMTLAEANEFVRLRHRHHKPVHGAKFCIGIADTGGTVRGVAIVGRPVARMLDDGWTLEVNRTCTDGVRNGNSMLYGAAWRAARAMGYRKCVTYILPEEGGASLRASGWKCIGEAGGGTWNRTNRPRVDLHPTQTKIKYEISDIGATLGPDTGGGGNDAGIGHGSATRPSRAQVGSAPVAPKRCSVCRGPVDRTDPRGTREDLCADCTDAALVIKAARRCDFGTAVECMRRRHKKH